MLHGFGWLWNSIKARSNKKNVISSNNGHMFSPKTIQSLQYWGALPEAMFLGFVGERGNHGGLLVGHLCYLSGDRRGENLENFFELQEFQSATCSCWMKRPILLWFPTQETSASTHVCKTSMRMTHVEHHSCILACLFNGSASMTSSMERHHVPQRWISMDKFKHI